MDGQMDTTAHIETSHSEKKNVLKKKGNVSAPGLTGSRESWVSLRVSAYGALKVRDIYALHNKNQ